MDLDIRQIGSEMRQLWSADDIVRWPARALERLGIPSRSKRFMVEVGLPYPSRDFQKNAPYITDVDELPRINEARPNLRVFSQWKTIGAYCLDELSNGRVIHVWGAGNFSADEDEFINSSIEQYAASLIVYQKYMRDREPFVQDSIDMDGYLRVFDGAERQLRLIDQSAWEGMPEGWRLRKDYYQLVNDHRHLYWPSCFGELNEYYP